MSNALPNINLGPSLERGNRMKTMPQNIIPRFFFETIEAAVAYAKGGAGGWIAACEDGSICWFDASVFTKEHSNEPSPFNIIQIILKEQRGPSAKIASWQYFDPTHASHPTIRHKSGN